MSTARMTVAVTQEAITVLLKQAGFVERVPSRRGRRAPAPAGGFQVFGHDGGGVLVCWIPAAGQDPRDLTAFGCSFGMAEEYAAVARKAGLAAEHWGVVWHYALITAPTADASRQENPRTVPASIIGTPFPGRPGYVTGTCGDPVDEDEWNAGHRTCEGC